MKRDSALLRAVGEALYGPQWQSQLAYDLEISDRTVRRWAASLGEDPIPAGIWAELAKLCAKRGKALAKLAETLSG